MTILVLGDSFADRMQRHGSWCDILGEILNEDVENYGLGGSSLSYSYNQFLKHYKPGKYSRIVFCATDYMRHLYFTDTPVDSYLRFHIDKKVSSEEMRVLHENEGKTEYPKSIDAIQNKILSAQQLIHAYYPNTYIWTERAITDSLKYTVQEPLLIMKINELIKIQALDFESLGIKLDTRLETKQRPNHLSMKQSYQLAQYIAKYFTEDFDIQQVFDEPKIHFTISKTKEEAGLK